MAFELVGIMAALSACLADANVSFKDQRRRQRLLCCQVAFLLVEQPEQLKYSSMWYSLLQVSLLAQSTFDTDYICVKAQFIAVVIDALKEDGHRISASAGG